MIARSDVAYLCRRAGFGATSAELDALSALADINALVDRIVDDPRNYGTIKPHPAMPSAGAATSGYRAQIAVEKLGRWYLERMTTARFVTTTKAQLTLASPLREKMVLFWHGLLVSSMQKPENYNRHPTIFGQHTLFRNFAVDDFQTLMIETTRDPAMLIYLDNWISTKDNPNENFAREVQELFTMGVGNYTQAEVVAAAKAGTGYTLDRHNKFVFAGSDHDNSNKTYFGTSANWDLTGNAANSSGHDIIQYICTNKQSIVASYLSKLLWQYFANFTPAAATQAAVAAAFVQSGNLKISDALRAIFKHPDFWAAPARAGKVKNPPEWVVANTRALGITKLPSYHGGTDPLSENMNPMGLMLFFQPNVAGWWRKPENKWIGFPAFTAKVDILDWLTDFALRSKTHPLWALAAKPSATAVDTVLGWYGIDPATADPTRARAITMFDTQRTDGTGTYRRVGNLARLIALSPAAQVN